MLFSVQSHDYLCKSWRSVLYGTWQIQVNLPGKVPVTNLGEHGTVRENFWTGIRDSPKFRTVHIGRHYLTRSIKCKFCFGAAAESSGTCRRCAHANWGCICCRWFSMIMWWTNKERIQQQAKLQLATCQPRSQPRLAKESAPLNSHQWS
jgi:hypothetical protein